MDRQQFYYVTDTIAKEFLHSATDDMKTERSVFKGVHSFTFYKFGETKLLYKIELNENHTLDEAYDISDTIIGIIGGKTL